MQDERKYLIDLSVALATGLKRFVQEYGTGIETTSKLRGVIELVDGIEKTLSQVTADVVKKHDKIYDLEVLSDLSRFLKCFNGEPKRVRLGEIHYVAFVGLREEMKSIHPALILGEYEDHAFIMPMTRSDYSYEKGLAKEKGYYIPTKKEQDVFIGDFKPKTLLPTFAKMISCRRIVDSVCTTGNRIAGIDLEKEEGRELLFKLQALVVGSQCDLVEQRLREMAEAMGMDAQMGLHRLIPAFERKAVLQRTEVEAGVRRIESLTAENQTLLEENQRLEEEKKVLLLGNERLREQRRDEKALKQKNDELVDENKRLHRQVEISERARELALAEQKRISEKEAGRLERAHQSDLQQKEARIHRLERQCGELSEALGEERGSLERVDHACQQIIFGKVLNKNDLRGTNQLQIASLVGKMIGTVVENLCSLEAPSLRFLQEIIRVLDEDSEESNRFLSSLVLPAPILASFKKVVLESICRAIEYKEKFPQEKMGDPFLGLKVLAIEVEKGPEGVEVSKKMGLDPEEVRIIAKLVEGWDATETQMSFQEIWEELVAGEEPEA